MFIKFYKNYLLISKFIRWDKYDTCIWEDYIIFILPTKLGTLSRGISLYIYKNQTRGVRILFFVWPFTVVNAVCSRTNCKWIEFVGPLRRKPCYWIASFGWHRSFKRMEGVARVEMEGFATGSTLSLSGRASDHLMRLRRHTTWIIH